MTLVDGIYSAVPLTPLDLPLHLSLALHDLEVAHSLGLPHFPQSPFINNPSLSLTTLASPKLKPKSTCWDLVHACSSILVPLSSSPDHYREEGKFVLFCSKISFIRPHHSPTIHTCSHSTPTLHLSIHMCVDLYCLKWCRVMSPSFSSKLSVLAIIYDYPGAFPALLPSAFRRCSVLGILPSVLPPINHPSLRLVISLTALFNQLTNTHTGGGDAIPVYSHLSLILCMYFLIYMKFSRSIFILLYVHVHVHVYTCCLAP